MSDEDIFCSDLCCGRKRVHDLSKADMQSRVHPKEATRKSPCVPRFVVLGVPSSGKSELARRLCSIWCCEYVNASNLITEHISNGTLTGCSLIQTMKKGDDLQDSDVLRIITEKLDSSDCRRLGYVLDDYPTNSEKYRSISDQLNVLGSVSSKPNCYIYINTSKEEHFRWWIQKRIDPETGYLYHPNEQGIYERNTRMPLLANTTACEQHSLIQVSGEQLVIRHEDLPESIEKHFDFFKRTMQPAIDKFLKGQGTTVIHLQSNNTHEDLFVDTIQALYNNSDSTELCALDLFGEKENDTSTETDTRQESAPSKRRRWRKFKGAFGCKSSGNQNS